MLGAQINNSSAWPAMLPKVWPAIEYLHANTVEMPVYWSSSAGAGAIRLLCSRYASGQARDHRVHLVCSGSAPGRTAAATTCQNGPSDRPSVFPG